jgi:hypothetical protein
MTKNGRRCVRWPPQPRPRPRPQPLLCRRHSPSNTWCGRRKRRPTDPRIGWPLPASTLPDRCASAVLLSCAVCGLTFVAFAHRIQIQLYSVTRWSSSGQSSICAGEVVGGSGSGFFSCVFTASNQLIALQNHPDATASQRARGKGKGSDEKVAASDSKEKPKETAHVSLYSIDGKRMCRTAPRVAWQLLRDGASDGLELCAVQC